MKNANNEWENKNTMVSILFIVAIIAVIASLVNDKSFLGGLNSSDGSDVATGNTIITESMDINSLDKIQNSSTNNTGTNDNSTDNKNPEMDNNSDGSGDTSDNKQESPNEEKQRYFIEGDFLADGVVTDKERQAMDENTKYLQFLVDNAKPNSAIKLPAGIFYFTYGGTNTKKVEHYVIKLNDNVNIIGAGVDENTEGKYTILKPYEKNNTIPYGLDMFYYNEFRDSDSTNPDYLENVSFRDFIIDGEDVRGVSYNSSGKGFMINLCRNCSWDNMVVRNTDATGFGMDNVINGSITNSVAINCGKNANEDSYGASGFGVGTGYSNEESMYIENCRSIGNKKFGFFFEHQNRFRPQDYKATESQGFVVVNSYASGNLYNFGGERSNDSVYINCTSDKDTVTTDGTPVGYTRSDIYFSDQSRRVGVLGLKTNNQFRDVLDSNRFYYNSVNWALRIGLLSDVSSDTFGVGINVTRAEAITLLWKQAGNPGDVLDGVHLSNNNKGIKIETNFQDVPTDAPYVSAVKWAVDTNVVNGMGNSKFNPNGYVTRAEFVTMLWRHAGSPIVNIQLPFNDIKQQSYYYEAVKWAYKNNIVLGITDVEFSPSGNCTREQIVTFLYRYQNSSNSRFSIRYLLFGGSAVNNSTYLAGTDTFKLANPTKNGYTFIGWTGSNGTTPSKDVVISKNDVGNKIFIANFKPNN